MKYKVSFNRKKLSEQELTRHMDFDKFINGAPAASGSALKSITALKSAIITGIAAVAVIAGYFLYHRNEHKEDIKPRAAFINPPLDSVDVPYSSFAIDPSKDTILVYETGSTIHIPAGAFVDEKGNVQKGKLELRYREFNDPLEIFLSGIPMEYDSAGTVYHFESAGMFQLEAYIDGKPVDISRDKPLTVNMISGAADNDYNLYYLDTAKQCWNYVSPSNTANGSNMPLFTPEIVNEYAASQPGMQEPVRLDKADPSKYNFTIDYKAEEFPELAMYEGVKFQVDDREHSYDPKLSMKIWQDVFIRRKDKKYYTVTFSREGESHTFTVIPVVEGDVQGMQKTFEQRMAEYTLALKEKKTKASQKEEIVKANYLKYMNEAQWSDVNSRINEIVKKDPVNYRMLAMRSFNINMAGTWNCDRPRFFQSEPRYAAASLYDQRGKPLKAEKVCLIIKGINMLYSYYVSDNKVSGFCYGKDDKSMLLAVTADGYPAFMKEDEFAAAANEPGELHLKMHVSSRKIKTVEELKEMFNL